MRGVAAAFAPCMLAALLLAPAWPAAAESLYITEKLVVGVYPDPTLDGERLAMVRSADQVEVLAREGEAAQIRLADGTEGWVKASYLESDPPLATRVSDLESENRKLRTAASKPGEQLTALQKDNSTLRAELDSARRQVSELQRATSATPAARPDDDAPIETVKPKKNPALTGTVLLLLTAAVALGGGFAWGYWHLDRRIRRKFGGLKPY